MLDKNKLNEFFEHDEDLIKASIHIYLSNLDKMIQDVEESFTSNDADSVFKSVHFLKGATSNFQLDELVNELSYIEDFAKKNKLNEIFDNFKTVKAQLRDLKKEMTVILES